MISPRLAVYGVAALAVVLVLAAFLHRGAQLESARNALAAANAQVAMIRAEITSCRQVVGEQNAQIEALGSQSESASAAAAQAARAALQRPRPPLAGHGPGAMNAWLEGLR